MIRAYYMLTKPGIIMGNLITTAAGFILASRGAFDGKLFLAALVSITFVIGSACLFNNYIDRKCDKRMARTQKRGFAAGTVDTTKALILGVLLLAIGLAVSALFINALVTVISFSGFCVYVLVYSNWKYRSANGTLVGSIAGALPPVIGYCSVSNRLDIGALALFATIVFWQMPHFYAIAIYRFDEYMAAAIPVLPVKKGVHSAKVHMLMHIILFFLAAYALVSFGYTGQAYLVSLIVLSAIWILYALKGLRAKDDIKWAKGMFRYSLIVVMTLSIMIALDGKGSSFF